VRNRNANLQGEAKACACSTFIAPFATASSRYRVADASELTASRVIAMFAVVLMTALLIDDFVGPTPAASSAAAEPQLRSQWFEVTRPSGRVFAGPPVARQSRPAVHGAPLSRRRRTQGSDDLGTPGDEGGYVRVSLYRPGGAHEHADAQHRDARDGRKCPLQATRTATRCMGLAP
jgi:hypothetical protein